MTKQKTTIPFIYKGKERTVRSNTSIERFREINAKNELTKADIENLAKDIRMWAADNRQSVGWDFSLLYNGKHDYDDFQWNKDATGKLKCKRVRKVEDHQDPHKWCEYFPEDFILGLTVDGKIYEMLNYGHAEIAEAKLSVLLKAYGLYLECADYCYWYAVPFYEENIEYTHWEKEKIVYLYRPADDVLPELNAVMHTWYDLAKETGDIGACTIGEYMEFVYKGTKYRMSSQSPYQGDYSWSAHVETIKNILREIGATSIYMNYGRLD